jgi:Flp pilus assembly protein TadD
MSVASWFGRTAALLALWLLASPASAAWRRAESANFIVYSQGSEAGLRQDTALLEDYNAFLRLLTGVDDPPPPNKLKVYVVRGHGALKAVRPRIDDDVAGFYTASESGIAAFVNDFAGAGGPEDNQILFHEIAHHFMLQYRPTAYPPWYVEGFAEYVMTARFEKDSISFGQASTMRARWLANVNWLPLERILFEPLPKRSDENALYYAESWLLVHYLLRDEGRRAKAIEYLNATGRGEAPRAAFARIFGIEPKAMMRDLQTYGFRQMTYSRLKRRSATAAPAIAITPLPSSADDLLLLEAAMEVGVDRDNSASFLTKVRAVAGDKADAYSRRVLAKAEALYGDGAAADKLLDPLLAAAPGDAELLYLKGMRHLIAARRGGDPEAAERKAAQIWFGKAHQADPNHFQTLVRYAESLSGGPRFVSENTTNILLLAHELAPQVPEITMRAAHMLLRRGQFDNAALLLTPLASSAHQPELAAAAQALLRRAQARQSDEPGPDIALPDMPPLPPGKR